jgi:protein-S-isoprenylcysteine O-methyltransferase Ste14
MRHPIYASYLLAMVSAAAIAARAELLAIPIWMMVLYQIAARREEVEILKSPLRRSYLIYASRTGMFIPSLTGFLRSVASSSKVRRASHSTQQHDTRVD